MLRAVPRTSLQRLLVATAAALVVAAAAPAWAQEGAQEETTTTSSSSTTVTLLPTTSTTTKPSSTTSTTGVPDPDDPVGGVDAPEDEVPVSDDTVPPRDVPPGEEAQAYAQQAAQVIRGELAVAEADAVATRLALEQAQRKEKTLAKQLRSLKQRVARLNITKRLAILRLDRARERFEERAADALIRGSAAEMASYLDADDPNELGTRATLMQSVLEEDENTVQEYLAAKQAVDRDLRATADRLARTKRALKIARVELKEAERINAMASVNLAVFAAGGEIVISGFVFPVGDPHTFGDSFGAPRMTGTKYEHSHQGTDILAPAGTDLLACERGIITQLGTDVLGGIKLWLKGESGTYYYYAHLTDYAEGLHEGQLVEAGDVVGYVGTTGNAKGGPAHLHFEIHPDGGAAVNPYPLLAVVDQLRKLNQAQTQSSG